MSTASKRRLLRAVKKLENKLDQPDFEAGIQRARETPLLTIAQQVFPDFEVYDYHHVIVDVMERMLQYFDSKGATGIQKATLSIPRRCSKSTLAKILAFAFMARYPNEHSIFTSYGSSLSQEHSRDIRDYTLTPGISELYPQMALDPNKKSVAEWGLQHFRGGMTAEGIRGGLTGKGYSLLICDDLVKNWEEATSPLINEAIWKELQACAISGADRTYAIQLVIGTRWTKDDPIGRLLDTQSGEWLEVKMPAIAEEEIELKIDGDVVYQRPAGSVLEPEKHSLAHWEKIKDEIPEYLWRAQCQQEPVDALGIIIRQDWIEDAMVPYPPRQITRVARGWDLAFTDNVTSDYTVGVKLGLAADGTVYVLDMQRFKVDFENLAGKIAATIVQDGQQCTQYIERNGQSQNLLKILNMDQRLYGYQLSGRRVDTNKMSRASAFILKMGERGLKIISEPWSAAMRDEMLSFTGHKDAHDDIIDAISICYNNMMLDGDTSVSRGRLRI